MIFPLKNTVSCVNFNRYCRYFTLLILLVSELAKLGEYAGNDAIVAFARLYQVTVVIHQPNFPLWQIKDWESVAGDNLTKNDEKHFESNRQLHIAYHGGDHYDSVRRLGDTSHIPANISLQIDDAVKKPSKADETFDSYDNSDDDDADYHVNTN